MYHALESPNQPCGLSEPGELLYVLSVAVFRQQMKLLSDEGFSTVFIEDLIATERWPEKAVILTFDDGHVSNFTLALPILEEFGFKGLFFITTDWVGKQGYMSEDQINELSRRKMSIGGHSHTHPFLNELGSLEAFHELQIPHEFLSRIIGNSITAYSLPGGRRPKAIESMAEVLGYKTIYTSLPGFFKPSTNPFLIPRTALKRGMGLEDLRRIIYIDPLSTRSARSRAIIKHAGKKILGDLSYTRLRNILQRLVGI
jgi:peptidoglycan/xylan/chitin deacetylase (PgdA/CDA1 family)